MASLSELEIPSAANGPTVCERNSRLLTSSTTSSVSDYRKLDLITSVSQRKNLACIDARHKPIFLNTEEKLPDKLLNKWSNDGVYGVIDMLARHENCPAKLQPLTEKLKEIIDRISGWKPKMSVEKDNSRVEYRKTLMKCHPHTSRIAFVYNENEVKIIKLNKHDSNTQEIIFKDKRVNQVTCIAWRPKSSMSIAVGSVNGILVWFTDGTSASMRPGSSTARFLYSDEIASNDVSSLSWSNDGVILAASYKNSASFLVWNIISQNCTVLQRVGSPTSFTEWSHCGQRLLTATKTDMFRVWEAKTWTNEKWADLNGKCKTACWSSCGTFLLFTVENEPFIYYINFYKTRDNDEIDLGITDVALKCADLTASLLERTDTECDRIGGLISSMVWDPSNSRLALTFEGEDGNQPLIALFHTRISPSLQITPCGYVQGERGEIPVAIDFMHGFEKGTQLVVCWSSDSLSVIPLYFNTNLASSVMINATHIESHHTANHTFGEANSMQVLGSSNFNQTDLYSL